MKIGYLSSQQCREQWAAIRPLLAEAIERSNGRWTSDHVLAALATNEQMLWVAENDEGEYCGAATVQVVNYPEKRFLAIHFLGGEDFDQWYAPLLESLTEAAKHFNCSGIECNARFGFWKWFKQDGFEKASTFYEKRV